MRVIGLTGGIASGKTTVGRFFSEWGIPVIDADQLAREVVEIGTRGLSELIQHFGPEYLTNEDVLDREKLAKRVFSDPNELAALNNIMLPRVQELSRQRIQEIQDSDNPAPYMIYDAALHIETGSYRNMDALIVVATPKELQLGRLMRRKGLTEEQALERIEAQLPLSERLPFANYVIENDDDLEAFRDRARAVHLQISGVRQGMSTYDQDVQTLIGFLSSEEAREAAMKPMLDTLEKELPELPWEKIVNRLQQRISEESVQIYKDRFTHDEIRDILTFYRTGTGTKLLRIYPGLIRDIQAVSLKEVKRLLQPYLSDL